MLSKTAAFRSRGREDKQPFGSKGLLSSVIKPVHRTLFVYSKVPAQSNCVIHAVQIFIFVQPL